MVLAIRRLLLGQQRSGRQPIHVAALAIGAFTITFVAYALGVFYVSGGVVFIPYYAAVVGMVAACLVGYRRDGLAVGWLVTYAALLGYHADHAFLGISHRPLADRLAYFVRPDGLVFLGVEAVVLGSLAFFVGFLGRWVRGAFGSDSGLSQS